MSITGKKQYTVTAFNKLESTQAYILSNLDSLPCASVITAKEQTTGRGRLTRPWQSPAGGLYFSILLNPDFKNINNLQNLTQCISVALCKTLALFNIKASIKWPNDVLVNGKKIAGTLSNTVVKGNKVSVVLGMGVNINEPQEGFPGLEAVSLSKLTGRQQDINLFLTNLLDNFFGLYQGLINNGFEFIKNDYLSFFDYIGKEINVENGASNISGTIVSVNSKGELLINSSNEIITINTGDVICLPSR